MTVTAEAPTRLSVVVNPAKAKASRIAGYERNMNAMRAFKELHPCKDCRKKFPHFVMEFAAPKGSDWSISRLAGSRCTLEVLNEAMETTDLLCSNCKRIRENKA